MTRASPSILLLASLEDSDRGVRVGGRGRGGLSVLPVDVRDGSCGEPAPDFAREDRGRRKKKMREKREMKNERKKREGCVGKQIKESGERGEGGRGRGRGGRR